MTIKEFVEKIQKKARWTVNGYDERVMMIKEKDFNKLLRQAEQERTNFEKWRDDRDISDYVGEILQSNYWSDRCISCPFVGKEDCPRIKHKNEYRCIEASECYEVLMEWANKRCEE